MGTTGYAFGDVTVGYVSRSVAIEAQGWQLRAWATRPGAVWPCSVLRQCEDGIRAEFDSRGDLVDLTHAGVEDVPADEFNAWASDVLASAGVALPWMRQVCRGCGQSFPYDADADYCPACVAVNEGRACPVSL